MRIPTWATRPSTVRSLSSQLRRAIEQTRDELARVSPDFRDFPRGSCSSACFLLGRWLNENGHGDFKYVLLKQGIRSHVWLQNGNLVADITGDQFGPPVPSVYVGDKKEHRLATMFEERCRTSADYHNYDLNTRSRLDALYRVLTTAIHRHSGGCRHQGLEAD